MPTLSLWANGYPNPYRDDAEEISVLSPRRGRLGTHDPDSNSRAEFAHLRSWWPHSVDFEAEARRGGWARGVGNLRQMINAIDSQRRLSEVRVYGHGASNEFQFGTSRITVADTVTLSDISSRFEPDGILILYACNVGFGGNVGSRQGVLDRALLQGLANNLRIRVRGFTQGIRWIVRWNEADPPAITFRGRDPSQALNPIDCTPT